VQVCGSQSHLVQSVGDEIGRFTVQQLNCKNTVTLQSVLSHKTHKYILMHVRPTKSHGKQLANTSTTVHLSLTGKLLGVMLNHVRVNFGNCQMDKALVTQSGLSK